MNTRDSQKPNQQPTSKEHSAVTKSNAIEVPSISLPKGGGAIKSIDEKFSVNAANGTAGFSIPFPFSPSRNGFMPSMALSYNSGGGNGIFGLGWNAEPPSILRKTDKKLPEYNDAEESDVFLFSGAEDLVPILGQDPASIIKRYMPRIEGGFARIEKINEQGNVYWKVTSKDNVVSIFGKTAPARIADPTNPAKIYKWLLEFSYDDKGNCFQFAYEKEDAIVKIPEKLNEKNRRNGIAKYTNAYLKRIKYCNKVHFDRSTLNASGWENVEYLLELVLDYKKIKSVNPQPGDTGWTCRVDPFSDYRSGFDIRTYRLCRRILMFHNFAELSPDPLKPIPCLVRSLDFKYNSGTAFTFLHSITQTGYIRDAHLVYSSKSLPPVEFKYERLGWHPEVKSLPKESLENLPVGIDDQTYQWIDLHGDGLSGILTEQANGWYYKGNSGYGNFDSLKLVSPKPSMNGLSNGAVHFQDLEANGQKFLVSNDLNGFYECTPEEEWLPFKTFNEGANINLHDANTKMLDLNGDGKADILISEDDMFVWYASKGKQGFDSYRTSRKNTDEEKGPNIVFADSTQSIVLADMSGDGLMDIVRIRCNDIAYWPNLGYGKFGAKVSMSKAPAFDHPDHFNPKYIKLGDLDGSGTTDIVYIADNSFKIYFNQSGNSWSDVNIVKGVNPLPFPAIDDHTNVNIIDLLGNGTGCIVWSSPLPAYSGNPLRYIDLMNGKKPHIMTSYKNNMGKEVTMHYKPSTYFYLEDKKAGHPWITKLPFPVQCVSQVTIIDNWRKTCFSNQYTYHHGYYDYIEREFRGFGRVDQIDVESFGQFAAGNIDSPYITNNRSLYQPPVLSKTWFHTGAFIRREKILSQFETEYFRPTSASFHENQLPPPDLEEQDLTTEEWRQALRSCKGMMLRQEIYELDVDELEKEKIKQVKFFSSAYHNCNIKLLQPKSENLYAVFLTTESETITYNYELNLRDSSILPDPRIAHSINLSIDELGNVKESLAIVYPRIGRHMDNTLPAGAEDLIADIQRTRHVVYTVNSFTNDVDDASGYRLRTPHEVKTYELTGLSPDKGFYFTIDELRHPKAPKITPANFHEIAYHILPNGTTEEKRLIENKRVVYFNIDLINAESPGVLNHLALPYETYTLALTSDLLTNILGGKLNTLKNATETYDEMLSRVLTTGGYHLMDGRWWIRSGIAGFTLDPGGNKGADNHFYLPEKYTDAFNNETTLQFDDYDLYIKSSDDALGNHTEVLQFDFRVLTPSKMIDINNNETEMLFDIIGMPVAMAVKGKGTQGDNLINVQAEIVHHTLVNFFTTNYDESKALLFLGTATARYVYYTGETIAPDGTITYAVNPVCAAAITREKYVAQLAPGETSPLQIAFQYSDGSGTALAAKVKAEPKNPGLFQWITNGKTILNNKGKPVKQYEPYFTDTHNYIEPVEVGVTVIIYYDAAGRVIRTEMPDGSYNRVEFTPWYSASFDQNDTILEPNNEWYNRFIHSSEQEKAKAALLATVHANTPSLTFLDSLGRDVVSIAHNKWTPRGATSGVTKEEKYMTYTKLDAEGKPLWIVDARSNKVMEYILPYKQTGLPETYMPCYDIAGNLLYQHSMDAGDHWMLNDCMGKPMYAWDSRQHRFSTAYDKLHRPTKTWLHKEATNETILIGLEIYGEEITDNGQTTNYDKSKNLRGKIYKHYDQSGCITNVEYDFKGNLLEVNRSLTKEIKTGVSYQTEINWNVTDTRVLLEAELFTQTTNYDALNRMKQLDSWHNSTIPASNYFPEYNERGLLKAEQLFVRGVVKPLCENYIISSIEYDAKGQKQKVVYGNGTVTSYNYDEKTFRLKQLRTLGMVAGNTTQQTLQDLNYTYDPVGNITAIIDNAQQTIFFRNAMIIPHCFYEYDALYRLVKAQGREHNGQHGTAPGPEDNLRTNLSHPNDGNAMGRYIEYYEYDGVGNILKMRHYNPTEAALTWVRQYQYEIYSNRLIGTGGNDAAIPYYANAPSGLAEKYQYNEHGSIKVMPHLKTMDWDFTEHLQHIVKGTQEAWYRYDAQKQRTRKIVENKGIIKERIYLGGLEIYREWDHGTLTEENETIQLVDSSQRMILIEYIKKSKELAPGTILYRYQHSNHLGSATLELDESNKIISYEEYYPYGETSYQAVSNNIRIAAKRYRYTGMERDEESGLAYHSARYYLPWLGRWLSADPIGIGDGVNVYAYTNNRVINSNDKKGKATFSEMVDSVSNLNENLGQFIMDMVHDIGKMLVQPLVNKFEDNKKAAGSFKKGNFVEGLGLLTGINRAIEDYGGRFNSYKDGGASTGEALGLMVGDATGFNNLGEAITGADKFANLLSDEDRAVKAAIGTSQLANTIAIARGIGSKVNSMSSAGKMDAAVKAESAMPKAPPASKYAQTFAEWTAERQKNEFSFQTYPRDLKPLLEMLEKLGPELEKVGINPKDIHVNPYKGGTGGGFILASGEIALDVEALTRLVRAGGLTAAESAEAILWHEVAHKQLGHYKNLNAAGEIIYSEANEIAADMLGAKLTRNPNVKGALLDHANQPK